MRRSPFWLIALLLGAPGCVAESIDTTYGQRRGAYGAKSVNGTAVLADMFEEAGHQVSTWRRISPKLDDYKVIVWAPDDFAPPTRKQRSALENWVARGGERTLVYIGRDYDAGITYWNKILPRAPAEQQAEVRRRLANARAEHDQARAGMPKQLYCRWFTMRRGGSKRQVRSISSPHGDWDQGIDASRLEIEIEGRLDVPRASDIPQAEADSGPAPLQLEELLEYVQETHDRDLPDFEILLQSKSDVLVTRLRNGDWKKRGNQIIVIVNGSFLLNLPLVQHEHRKLAGKLIRECGQPAKVVFLESGPGGPPVYSEEPATQYPTGLEVFTVWPLGFIIIHLMLLGILSCFVLFPIFGRPRTTEQAPLTDFGKHVEALGKLLEQTNDVEYARRRLEQYQQMIKRDAPASQAEQQQTVTAAATENDPYSAI